MISLKRVRLGRFPTPIEYAPRLSEKYKVHLWFKDDAATGFGFGGNKLRSLEYILGDFEQYDRVIFAGGTKSNFIRAGVIAALSKGLEVECVFFGQEPQVCEGNYRLVCQLGVRKIFTGDPVRESAEDVAVKRAEELRRQGSRVKVVPRGGALPEGVFGFYHTLQDELEVQSEDIGRVDHLILAVGSGVTLAGLRIGRDRLLRVGRIWGFCSSRPLTETVEVVDSLAKECNLKFDLGQDFKDRIEIRDDTFGEGYGQLSERDRHGIKMVLAMEGVSLDPVFNAKAFSGFERLVESGQIKPGENVLFFNGGGIPEVFKD